MCKIVDLIVKSSFIFKLQSFSFTSVRKQKVFFFLSGKKIFFFLHGSFQATPFDLTALPVGLTEIMGVRLIKHCRDGLLVSSHVCCAGCSREDVPPGVWS